MHKVPLVRALHHEGTVSIGGRTITNLRFVDDIDGLAGQEEELASLVERLGKASTAHGIEISAVKTKLMTNNTSGINTEIIVNGQRLETVASFKYLGSVITDEGSKPEILSRIAQATAALTRLKPVWIDKSISLSSKIRLMRSLVTSLFLTNFFCIYRPPPSKKNNFTDSMFFDQFSDFLEHSGSLPSKTLQWVTLTFILKT